jgi:hypothetical protein
MKHTGEKKIEMMRILRVLAILLVPMVALILGISAPRVWADDDVDEISFEEADVYAELNDTDEDLGFHALIDGEGWKKLRVEDPNEKNILKLKAKSSLRRQGLTELFFESAEPTFDELSPEEFFARFPEGTYEIEGITLDGEELESEDLFSHVMPAAPANIQVNGGDPILHKEVDCETGEGVQEVELEEGEDVVISWDPVTSSHPQVGRDGSIVASLYQVVIEFETPDEFESKYSVDLPPSVTEATIPYSFIALGLEEDEGEITGEFKFEILVKEELGGNQTAAESCFEVVVVPANGE